MAGSRTRAVEERPDGLALHADWITADDEDRLLAFVADLRFEHVVMHGRPARRTVRHFGWDYDYSGFGVTATEPVPGELLWIRERAAELAGAVPDDLAECLVTRYPPGAGIGWHRDAPAFGPVVVGISLGAPCRMRFQRTAGGVRRVYALQLPPRSAYVLAGPARSAWQHSIPPVTALRHSITWRTVRTRRPR